LLLPLLRLLGLAQTWPLVVVGGMSGLIALACAVGTQRQWRVTKALGVSVLIAHGVLLATIGVLLGPLVISPLLVFGTFAMFATLSAVRLPRTVYALHLATFMVPLALEWLGVTPASYHFDGNALVLAPWAVDMAPGAILFLIVTMVIMQLTTNAIVLESQRKLQDRAQEQLHIQKWQLAQLVPSSGSSS
jgi:hypothetical protein